MIEQIKYYIAVMRQGLFLLTHFAIPLTWCVPLCAYFFNLITISTNLLRIDIKLTGLSFSDLFWILTIKHLGSLY